MKHSDDDIVSILETIRKEESLDSAPAQSIPICAEIDTDGMHCYALVQVAQFCPEGNEGHTHTLSLASNDGVISSTVDTPQQKQAPMDDYPHPTWGVVSRRFARTCSFSWLLLSSSLADDTSLASSGGGSLSPLVERGTLADEVQKRGYKVFSRPRWAIMGTPQ